MILKALGGIGKKFLIERRQFYNHLDNITFL